MDPAIRKAMWDKIDEKVRGYSSVPKVLQSKNNHYFLSFEKNGTTYELKHPLPKTFFHSFQLQLTYKVNDLEELWMETRSAVLNHLNQLLVQKLSHNPSQQPKLALYSSAEELTAKLSCSSAQTLLSAYRLPWKFTWDSFTSPIHQEFLPGEFFNQTEQDEIIQAGRQADPARQTWRTRNNFGFW